MFKKYIINVKLNIVKEINMNQEKIGKFIQELRKDKKLTQEEFIQRATEAHNGKYDYQKVNYVPKRTP